MFFFHFFIFEFYYTRQQYFIWIMSFYTFHENSHELYLILFFFLVVTIQIQATKSSEREQNASTSRVEKSLKRVMHEQG